MKIKQTQLFILACILCCAPAVPGQNPDLRLLLKVPNAVAIEGMPEIGYYILSADDTVYHYGTSGSGLQFSGRFSLQGTDAYGIDVTVIRDNNQDSIAVTEWSDKIRLGYVNRYSTEGRLIHSWSTLHHIPAGIDYDPGSHVLYFGTSDSNELYAVDIHENNPHYVCDVQGAAHLGPISLDPDRQLIYVTDSRGSLFVVDLRTRKTALLTSSFGLASALHFDSKTGILYVADIVQKKIYAVDPSSQNNRPVVDSAQIRSPSGLALGPDNTLLITDQRSGGVFLMHIAASETRQGIVRRQADKKLQHKP